MGRKSSAVNQIEDDSIANPAIPPNMVNTASAAPAPFVANPLPPAPPTPLDTGVHYRSIDGSGNNLSHPEMNSVGADFHRIGPAHFADGISEMRTGPNARDISNTVVAGNGDTPDAHGLSAYMYAWGQFIDHDLDLSKGGGADISISTSVTDPIFHGSSIALTRAAIDPNTGVGTSKVATTINSITGWLDASMVYGSDATTAASLRLSDGHMKTSSGNNLPIVDGAFLAGDVRAAENPDLTSLQTLFVREHNYQVDKLLKDHPDWTGDHLYEQAKAIVTAEIQHITYSEFLTHLLGNQAIRPYSGYRPNVDATITEEFAGAAYRFGHSIVSANLATISENGSTLAEQQLKNAFLEPAATFLATTGGADGFLRNLANDTSNALDVHIVDDLRNFLFSPGQGQDLAAINIQRGRDLGLGTLNETRIALGLKAYQDFSEITGDAATASALSSAYGGNIDSVDLWIGGLAETPNQGAMIGETFGIIIAKQFEALRDGDRFWYQNQGFDNKTLSDIDHTSLSDIILRDTDTVSLQSDVFVAYERHSGSLGGVAASSSDTQQLVIGSTNGDTLTGGSKDDILVAGSGAQSLIGGAGNDIYIVNNTSDVITELTNSGLDSVQSSVSYILGANVENLTLTGSSAINGTGHTLNNILTGNTGVNGLSGGNGSDQINGGKAADILTGGAGKDTFIFTTGDSGQTSGFDKISDFTKGNVGTGDVIDFSSVLTIGGSASAATSSQAAINQSTGIATFASGSGTTLTDALGDIASRFSAATNSVGEFAFFKVNNTGDYYAFISDGVAGVTANDDVIQLVGVTSISSINLTNGDLTITG